MKLLIHILIVCMFAINLQAVSYIYVQEGVKLPLPNQKVTLYNGVPVVVVSQDGVTAKVKLSGFVGKKSRYKLYATANLKLLFATTKKANLIKISGQKGTMEVMVPKKSLTKDMEEAWAINSDLFYNKCTKCHHAKIIEHHSMQEWGALFGSMKDKARTTKDQNALILRFLRAFAKDGILREAE